MGNKNKSKNTTETKKPAEKINIFSVASGHLYERLLSVMTLGVMKHTQTPVKFWLIENFLSPSFKVKKKYKYKNKNIKNKYMY